MKPGFNEGMLSNERDPVDLTNQEFDWQQLLLERLGEDAGNGDNDRQFPQAVIRLLEFLVSKTHINRCTRRVSGFG